MFFNGRFHMSVEVSENQSCESDAVVEICNNLSMQEETMRVHILFDQVFSIPLLLKEILKYLKFDEILEVSLVSKSWNFFAREILRDLTCVAEIPAQNACHTLKKLNGLLENTENVPYNGLSIRFPSHPESFYPHRVHECVEHAHPSEIFCNILSKITFKYFHTDFDGSSRCIAVGIIREILGDQEKAKALEELRFDADCLDVSCDLLGFSLKALSLPSLHFLEFQPNFEMHRYVRFEDNYVPCLTAQEVLKAAPNLWQISGFIHPHWLECLSQLNVLSSVEEFHYWPVALHSPCRRWVREFTLSNPTLFRLCFSTQIINVCVDVHVDFPRLPQEYRDEICQNVVGMLQSSQDDLNYLDLDQLSLILMMSQWSIPVMKNVEEINILFSPRTEECFQLSMLRKLDWSKNFPNLNFVTFVLCNFDKDIDSNFYVHEELRMATDRFSCKTVTKFMLQGYDDDRFPGDCMDFGILKVFINIFPCVKEFSTDRIDEFGDILETLWTLWEELENIIIAVRMSPPLPNIDSVMTGLSSEETDYLCGNFEDLQSLEVVPIKPGLAMLSKLKLMKFELLHPPSPCNEVHPATGPAFLSHVSGYCAFVRMPDLEVVVRRDLCGEKCYYAFDHLTPFVKLVASDNIVPQE